MSNTVMKKKKRSYRHLISNLLLITAIVLLNFPLVSGLNKNAENKRTYSQYLQTVSQSDEEEIQAITEEIDEYNASLVNNEGRFVTEKTSQTYEAILSAQPVIGYIDVPSAGVVALPIYKYASASSLQAGAGHMAGSSLPTDKTDSHMVISAHSGMSSMTGFSSLSKTQIGDEFRISYLDKILIYKVIRIETVDPDDLSLLSIEPGANYVSLVTCTPIGLNTHRLILTGYFLSEEKAEGDNLYVSTSEGLNITTQLNAYQIVLSGVSVPLLIILLIDLFRSLKKNKKIPVSDIEFIYLDEDDDLIDPKAVFRRALETYYNDKEGGETK